MANQTNKMLVTLLARGGTTVEWSEANPIPKDREICVEKTDKGVRLKVGDGVTPWNELSYTTFRELADMIEDSTHRTVTDAEKTMWNGKADDADISTIGKTGKLADAVGDSTHRTVTDAEKTTWNTAAARKIPSKTSDLTNDGDGESNFATEEYVKQKMTAVVKYKGTVATYADLPTTNREVGDTYNVTAAYNNHPAGTNWAWTGTAWDAYGGPIDLSGYIKKTEVSAIGKSGNLSDATEDASHRTVTDTEKATWNGKADDADISTIGKTGKLADATQDATHRTVSDAEKTTWNGKQNKLTFDTTPTANSTNPVTSGGMKTALDNKVTNDGTVMKTTMEFIFDGGTVE